ncbi:MAG: ATP-binding protein [Candidatus Sumerlaeaceae bacterium]|nr:ATP-binding protein [Candidatus Sumerlaeaceae bacterium]
MTPSSPYQRALTEEVEFLARLFEIQRRAFLPLQWVIFVLAFTFWGLSRPFHWPPPPDVFALFAVYFLILAAETYFLWISRTALRQVRPLCLVAYVADIVFVTMLVWFDSVRYAGAAAAPTDFYLLYFIVLLRSFALFRTARATLLVNALIGVLFLMNLFWQDTSLPTYSLRNNLIRLAFFWVVVFMSAIIAGLLNRQKAELSAAREKLVRSENMALLGQLAAGVAHEINNPISIISAYAEYLEKTAPPDDPRREDFAAIHREALRCQRIVDGLLGLARRSSTERVPVNIPDVIQQVFSLMAGPRDTADSVKLEFLQPDGDLPHVVADRTQLVQALLNVVLNARQALGERGGYVRVTARPQLSDNRVVITVEDNGRGIAPEDLPHVFEPFFSKRRGGTGLGLAITKRIIEDHGGTITLTSTPDAGTCVEINLPATPPLRRGSSAKLKKLS